MSSAAPSPSLRGLFSELEQLFQTETEARVSTSVQAAERSLAEHLNQSVRRLRQSNGFSEIASILCDASARFAKTCAVFRVNEATVGGERLRGGASGAEARFHEIRFQSLGAAAFAAALESREPVVALSSASEVSAACAGAMGLAAADKAYLFPLTVDQSTVGILVAAGDVEAAGIELLTQATAAVLEARQRPVRRDPPSAPAPPGLVSIESIEAAPAPSAAKTAKDWDDLSPADRQLHLRAQRFARTKVAEMRLYRSDAVKAGRAQGDLYTALQQPIDEGREEFNKKFVAASPNMVDYFHVELLRTLANDNPAWLGGGYPGRLL